MGNAKLKTHTSEHALIKQQFLLSKLAEQITDWAKETGWQVTRSELEFTDEPLGAYTLPSLIIDAPEGRLTLEPVGRTLSGKEGAELSAWPTLYRVRLLSEPHDTWTIMTDSGIPIRQPWNYETFLQLAKDLIRA